MPNNHKNILVIKLGALGDFIQSLGPMKAIRKYHPDSTVTLLTTKPFQGFAEKCGYFDDIWLDKRPKWHQPLDWLALRKKLNAGHFARVYDLQNNDRTALYLKLFSPHPEWVGAAPGASHRNTSPERTAGLAYHGHVQTLGLAGIHNVEIDTMDWIGADLQKFNLQTPYALIVPGSAPTRPEKRWPAEYYVSLCQQLSNQGIQPVLIGTDAEKTITGQIAQDCKTCLDLTGKTSLDDIVALGRGAACAIGNDTGPMHMIAPTGTKTFVLFTRHSNPVRHAPIGNDVQIVLVDEKSEAEVIENILGTLT